MNPYLKIMENRLTDEDRTLLQAIREPRIVTVPPCDACRSMCVTPDGEIRLYGALNKQAPEDVGTQVYMSSTDCGLSWKTHLMPKNSLGAAARNPVTGRYLAAYCQEFRQDLRERFPGRGTYVVSSDIGYDDPDFKIKKLTDVSVHVLRLPYYFAEIHRWFIIGEFRKPDMTKILYLFWSDDDGETWTEHVVNDVAPFFPAEEPHKGLRWQEYSCEPTLARLHDGTMIMIVRTSQNFHYIYRSSDNGETWSKPEPSPFHGTITMPVLESLSDGRLVFFWCNTQPMPELDHTKAFPPMDDTVINGIWEDVFTNRDANHLTITEDDGKTWIGMRELFLNAIRNYADFRSIGGVDSRDKSVHQAQILELPYNKLLICFGQNISARKSVILDIDWLYEKDRYEDFRLGLQNVTTHMFIDSNLGGFRGFSGHCAYNRTNGALLVKDPSGNFHEVLQICRTDDPRLVYQKQGVVWNFPTAKRGRVEAALQVRGSGIALSLTDHWYNACDEQAKAEAPFTIDIGKKTDDFVTVTVSFDTEAGTAHVVCGDEDMGTLAMRCDAPHGLSYLHMQTNAEAADYEGTLIRTMKMTADDI